MTMEVKWCSASAPALPPVRVMPTRVRVGLLLATSRRPSLLGAFGTVLDLYGILRRVRGDCSTMSSERMTPSAFVSQTELVFTRSLPRRIACGISVTLHQRAVSGRLLWAIDSWQRVSPERGGIGALFGQVRC